MLDPAVHEHVTEAAERGYQALSTERDIPKETVHAEPVCRDMTTLMVLSLFEAGESPRVDSRGGRLDEHRYVIIGDGPDEYVADPTWQQFLPLERRSSGLPKVLIGTRKEVMTFAAEAGVDPTDVQVWSSDVIIPPYRTPAERIAATIDQQM